MLTLLFSGFLATVSLSVVQSATTTTVLCPYRDPLSQGMSCLQGGFTQVQYRSLVPDPPQNNEGTAESEIVIAPAPDVPPPSTLDLSEDVIRYFCGENGGEMVDCAKNVTYLCTDHLRMEHFSFNPHQAERARELCPYIVKNFRETLKCINETVKADVFLSCSAEAYETFTSRHHAETYTISRCRSLAEAYNCYARTEEEFCEPKIIDFSVALMRVMEDRQCTRYVDSVYVAPVSKAIEKVLSPILVLLTLVLIGL